MRKLILAAASVVALGIGGVAVSHATVGEMPGPISSPGQTTQWWAGYGRHATPAEMARVEKELAFYREVASGQQRAQNGAYGAAPQYAHIGTNRALEEMHGGG